MGGSYFCVFLFCSINPCIFILLICLFILFEYCPTLLPIPTDSTLRASPYPEVMDPTCRLPLPPVPEAGPLENCVNVGVAGSHIALIVTTPY